MTRSRRKVRRVRGPASARRDTQGRTHLRIFRDQRGRAQKLTLTRPLFETAWQNDLALAAASTAHGLLAEGRTLAKTVELARSAMVATSKFGEGLLARFPDQTPACRSGCAHCCYQAVTVSAPEVFAIHEHLLATRSPDEFDAIIQRLRETDDRTRNKSAAERLSPELPCPFLEQGSCSIYDVRPLACRGKNSLDAALCERTLRDPDTRERFLDGSLTVPCYLEPIRAFHAVAAGLQLALHELQGLRMRPLELTAAVRILADEPETVTRRWLAGADPFQAARGAAVVDDDPQIRRLSGRLDD